ncbi:MAG: class I tRNA ligase family protein, partial [Bradymonadia bacterium]
MRAVPHGTSQNRRAHSQNQCALSRRTNVSQQDEDVLDTWFSSGLWTF